MYSHTGLFGSGLEVTLAITRGRLDGVYVEDSNLLVFRCDTPKCPKHARTVGAATAVMRSRASPSSRAQAWAVTVSLPRTFPFFYT